MTKYGGKNREPKEDSNGNLSVPAVAADTGLKSGSKDQYLYTLESPLCVDWLMHPSSSCVQEEPAMIKIRKNN